MKQNSIVGVRLTDETKEKAAKYAAALCIPQSSFVRILVSLGLEQVEQNPETLLKRFSGGAFPGM